MLAITKTPLALLLVVAAATSSGFSEATNLRQRKLGDYTTTTNINTYTSYEDFAVPMLAAVNKQRATQGLSPLCLNKKLHAAAQRHSDDMAAKDYMAHDGSDGSTMSQRVTQAGYDWSGVAENVAAGHIDVDDVMEAWIKSPGHLENIMGDYTMFGSAYAFNKNGKFQHYWTQEFGSSETDQCDTSAPSNSQDPSQYYEQNEAETAAPVTKAPVAEVGKHVPVVKAPPAKVPVTYYAPPIIAVPATKTPVTKTFFTDAPLTAAPTTSTPAAGSPKAKDCESNF